MSGGSKLQSVAKSIPGIDASAALVPLGIDLDSAVRHTASRDGHGRAYHALLVIDRGLASTWASLAQSHGASLAEEIQTLAANLLDVMQETWLHSCLLEPALIRHMLRERLSQCNINEALDDVDLRLFPCNDDPDEVVIGCYVKQRRRIPQ